MFRSVLRAALATLVAITASCAGAETRSTPATVERPQGARNGLVLTTLDDKAALQVSQAAIGTPVGDHVLLDREGRPTPLAKYRGKPLLVSFIYAACTQVCPTTTRNLKKAAEGMVAVLGADRFNIVSIGFNQPFDSPAALKAYAFQQGIALPNWEFLSPAPAIVDEITRNFGFSYLATAGGFDHINQVTLVDAEGRIVRQIYGDTLTAADLTEPLKTLIAGAPIPPQASTLAELGDRIRILCSVYDPVTGRYRTNYALYFDIAGFISFLVFLGWVARNFMRRPPRNEFRSG